MIMIMIPKKGAAFSLTTHTIKPLLYGDTPINHLANDQTCCDFLVLAAQHGHRSSIHSFSLWWALSIEAQDTFLHSSKHIYISNFEDIYCLETVLSQEIDIWTLLSQWLCTCFAVYPIGWFLNIFTLTVLMKRGRFIFFAILQVEKLKCCLFVL